MRARTGLALVAALAAAGALAAGLTGMLSGLEEQTLHARFALRHPGHPRDVVVVGIDDPTFSTLGLHWPFPRSVEARAVDAIHAAGARLIVLDIQFTEPTRPAQDLALYDAIAHAHGVILATTTSDHGHSDVLGGDARLAAIDARAARANVVSADGDFRAYHYALDGIPTIGVAAAGRVLGHPLSRARFGPDPAWIDYPGPPGSFTTLSFADVLHGGDRGLLRGRIVVVGMTSPSLQDVHATPTTGSRLMSGPEIQAAAIESALHGNPLRSAPGWLAIVCVLMGAALAPALAATVRARLAIAATLLGAVAYAVTAVSAFDAGLVLPVVAPLLAVGIGLAGTLIARTLAGDGALRWALLRALTLESTVRQRDRELSETELEIVHRLAHAAEAHDGETGEHIERIGRLCRRLGRAAGMTSEQARMFGQASIMHDVGKVSVPDAILRKPGRLDEQEWAAMRAHAASGAEILAGSSRPIIRMAETIARTHHERWDGSGYPAGLAGTDIPLEGRICAVCDVFDALCSVRPYKRAWTIEEAVAELRRIAGSHLDPTLVELFVGLVPRIAHVYDDASPASLRRAGSPPDDHAVADPAGPRGDRPDGVDHRETEGRATA